jgi:hypothetical protein
MHNIYVPTYPMEDMPTEALERAALNPYRFVASANKTPYYLGPSSIRLIPPVRDLRTVSAATTHLEVIEPEDIDPHLVRGGRYLFLAEKAGSTHSVHLMDLGVEASSTIRRLPSAFLTFEGESLHFFMSSVDPRGDMDRIRVFTNVLNAAYVCANISLV